MKFIKLLFFGGGLLIILVVVVYFIMTSLQETQNLEGARSLAKGKFITLRSGVTHYKIIGTGKPVVLIHGGGITGMEVWDKNAEHLAANGYQVLQYDLYGRGYSDRINGNYTPELLSDQLTELIVALNLRDSIAIISMSMGSMVAIDYASQNPDRVQSLVMIDPAITGDYKPNKLLKLPLLSDLLMTLYWYPRALENQRKEFVDMQVFNSYAERLAYFMNIEGYKHMNHSTWMHTLNQDKTDVYTNLKTNSILLIYGEKDPYFSADQAAKLKSLHPRLNVVLQPEAGHMPHFEKPESVNPLLVDFLSTNFRPAIEKPE